VFAICTRVILAGTALVSLENEESAAAELLDQFRTVAMATRFHPFLVSMAGIEKVNGGNHET
jgi:hypothetical protein